MKIFKTTSFLIILLSIISCASKKEVTIENFIAKKETTQISKHKILFLNYLLVKNKQNIKSVSLINQIKAEGKLKGKQENIINPSIGDLEYSFLDTNKKLIEKHVLRNPLTKTVEFVNDFGNFEKRVLDLDSVQFSIRTQLPPEAIYFVITELTNAEPIKHITTKID